MLRAALSQDTRDGVRRPLAAGAMALLLAAAHRLVERDRRMPLLAHGRDARAPSTHAGSRC